MLIFIDHGMWQALCYTIGQRVKNPCHLNISSCLHLNEDIGVSESFTYFGSGVVNKVGSCLHCYRLSQHGYLALSAPIWKDKDPHLKVVCVWL